MKVAQLKKELEKYPDDMDVFLADRKTEFTYGLLNSVKTDTVTFMDDIDLYDTEEKEGWEEVNERPKVECLILDEE